MAQSAAKPMPTARGIFSARLKSSTLKVMPMPSMMAVSPQVMNSPLNQVNHSGFPSASAPPATGNYEQFKISDGFDNTTRNPQWTG